MHFSSRSIFKVVLFCFTTGIRAKVAGKVTDHDDSLDLLKPGPATIHMFTEYNTCNNSTLQRKTSFETDRCHKINALFIKEFSFLAPPVCKNGTLAEYTAFQARNCWGDVWHSWEVIDMHVDVCLGTTADTKKLMGFVLVCDGIKRNNSKAGDIQEMDTTVLYYCAPCFHEIRDWELAEGLILQHTGQKGQYKRLGFFIYNDGTGDLYRHHPIEKLQPFIRANKGERELMTENLYESYDEPFDEDTFTII